MTNALSTTFPEQQMSAIARLESLRQFKIPEINQLLDRYTDMAVAINRGLTTRERICQLCNKLAALKDVSTEAQAEIEQIVPKLRSAFNVLNHLNTGEVQSLIAKLDNEYPVYDINKKLRFYNRSHLVRGGVQGVKIDAAQMVAELLVIAMDAENEEFLAAVRQTVEEITRIMTSWL